MVRKSDGRALSLFVRLYGLPYPQPERIPEPKNERERTPEQQREIDRNTAMINLLAATPGTVRNVEMNRLYARHVIERLHPDSENKGVGEQREENWTLELKDQIVRGKQVIGWQEIWLHHDGRFHFKSQVDGEANQVTFDGSSFFSGNGENPLAPMSLPEAKLNNGVVQSLGIGAANRVGFFTPFGDAILDGSDKAQSLNAFRFKLADTEDDWFYCWLSALDDRGGWDVQLLKASATKDCDPREGGVTFTDWSVEQGILYPARRNAIVGIGERVDSVILNERAVVHRDFDDGMFKISREDRQ
jgi:hypothetical protein